MHLKKITLMALACGAPLALRAGFDIGVNIGVPVAPVGGEVIISNRPPPEREEVAPPAPGPDYVWIHGHWRWSNRERRWEWAGGHWEHVSQPGAVWVHGHWDARGSGWVWVEGHWQMPAPPPVVYAAPPPPPPPPQPAYVQAPPPPPPAPGPEVVVETGPAVYAPTPPPAVYVERIGRPPGPDYFWVAGHWRWEGRWVWVHGEFQRHPHFHPGARWEDGHWDRRGNGYVWIEGRWR